MPVTMGAWVAIGVALGAVLARTGMDSTGFGLGIAIGVAIGAAVEVRRRRGGGDD